MIQAILELYQPKANQLQADYVDALNVFQEFYNLPARKIWEATFSNAIKNNEILAQHFTKVSNEEMCGHQLLDYVSQYIEDEKLIQVVKNHSADELRHAEIYRKLSDEILGNEPGSVEIKKIHPQEELGEGFNGDYSQLLISIHMGEIRGLLTLKYLIGELSRQSNLNADVIKRLRTIEKDERWHIVYTGWQLNEYLQQEPSRKTDVINYARRYQAFWWQDIEFISNVFRKNMENSLTKYG